MRRIFRSCFRLVRPAGLLFIALFWGVTLRAQDDEPPINSRHIFAGEVKRDGRAVGFHARPGGKNPPNAWVLRVLDPPNGPGVYTARVRVCRDASKRDCGEKMSSFFPDTMSRAAVLTAIHTAYRTAVNTGALRGEKFRGPGGHGFTIEGYVLRKGGRVLINTAYPIYHR